MLKFRSWFRTFPSLGGRIEFDRSHAAGVQGCMFRNECRSSAITLIELVVTLAVIGILVAILLPAIAAARESMRRSACQNHLSQLAIGLQNYHAAFRSLPPPVVAARPLSVVNVCDSNEAHAALNIWLEASQEDGHHGTSWMLHVLPFIEQQMLYDNWDERTSVVGNRSIAQVDIGLFYCPSRRSGVDNPMIMFKQWLTGGNDYGGCIGATNGWHNCGSHEFWQTAVNRRTLSEYLGAFHKVNRGSRFASFTDGLSKTILLGELQRLDEGYHIGTSRDGWAVGGVSTLFSTCSDGCAGPNSNHFELPGSVHPGGLNVTFADGSTQFLSNSISIPLFKAMGGMRDGLSEQSLE